MSGIITLNQPFPTSLANPDHINGTWPTGTRIANQSKGGSFKYSYYSALVTPVVNSWYRTTDFMGEIDISGTNIRRNFSPGTAFAKVFWLPNYSNRATGFGAYPITGPDHKVWFAGISITPENQAKLVSNTNGSKTIKVPQLNVSTDVMDIVTSTLTLEAV